MSLIQITELCSLFVHIAVTSRRAVCFPSPDSFLLCLRSHAKSVTSYGTLCQVQTLTDKAFVGWRLTRYTVTCLRSLSSLRGAFVTENGVPPSGNTRAVVGQSVAGRAPGVVGSKWRV